MKRLPYADDESWENGEDERPPAKLERRRHRDPEETDERRAAERRPRPRLRGRRSGGKDGDD